MPKAPIKGGAQQHFRNECDINRIMANYKTTGVITHTTRKQPRFGDFINVPQTFQEAFEMVFEAQDQFDKLPVAIRKRFNYDASSFFDFANDPANVGALREMGILQPQPAGQDPARSDPHKSAEGGDPATGQKVEGSSS